MAWTIDAEAALFCRLAYSNPGTLLQHAMGDVIRCEGQEHGGACWVFETETHNWAIFKGPEMNLPGFKGRLQTAADAYWRRVDGHEDLGIHRRFHEAWKEIAPDVYEEVYVLTVRQGYDEGSAKPTVYAGHSTGGAVATLAAATHIPAALITFGSPRVGSETFARKLDKVPTYNRWVHSSDFVPHLPPGFGYRHGGVEKLVTKDGDVVSEPGFWERVKEFVRNLRESGTSHRMASYQFAFLGPVLEDSGDGR